MSPVFASIFADGNIITAASPSPTIERWKPRCSYNSPPPQLDTVRTCSFPTDIPNQQHPIQNSVISPIQLLITLHLLPNPASSPSLSVSPLQTTNDPNRFQLPLMRYLARYRSCRQIPDLFSNAPMIHPGAYVLKWYAQRTCYTEGNSDGWAYYDSRCCICDCSEPLERRLPSFRGYGRHDKMQCDGGDGSWEYRLRSGKIINETQALEGENSGS